jgi:hypothetical protein
VKAVEHFRETFIFYSPAIPFDKYKKDAGDYKTVSVKLNLIQQIRTRTPWMRKSLFFRMVNPPKDWICWQINFDDVVRDTPITDGVARTKMACILLRGRALELFQTTNVCLRQENLTKPTNEQWNEETLFANVLDVTGRAFFPSQHAACNQKNFMQHNLYLDYEMTLIELVKHLK